MAKQVDYEIRQGETWERNVRWGQSGFVYKTITGIQKSAPIRLAVTGHELPDGWPFAVSDVAGMTQINAKKTPPDEDTEYYPGVVVDADTLEINAISSLGFTAYTSGGVIRYHPPEDLTGVTARMQLRKNVKSTVVIHELTTENGGITINGGSSLITLLLTEEETAAFDFKTAVYALDMLRGGQVFPIMFGQITLVKDATQ